jgi:hypothetical protein
MLTELKSSVKQNDAADMARDNGLPRVSQHQRYRFAGIQNMDVSEWIKVADNPRQRDTEKHARNARKRHLAEYDPKHARVDMARMPDGTTYKIDGHTRAYLWAQGQLEAPNYVQADVWDCVDIAAVKELYTRYDNELATERTSDKIYGALREHNVEFQSPLLRSQKFGGALRQAYEMMFGQAEARRVGAHWLVNYWMPELQVLDDCYPTQQRFASPVVTAALITLRRRGRAIEWFWRAYAADEGTKNGGQVDAVQAFDRRVQVMRQQKNLGGRHAHQEAVAVAISATEAWLGGRTYNVATGIKQSKHKAVSAYLQRARTVGRSR